MPKLLWNDCNGSIITTELLLVASVLVAGLLTTLSTFRTSVESEFEQLGERIQQSTSLHQSQSAPLSLLEAEPVEGQIFQAADLPGLID